MLNARTSGPLAASNSLALAVAAYESWSLIDLLVVYWTQNVVIGIANIARILKVERFSTAGFMMDNEPVSATPAGRRQVALHGSSLATTGLSMLSISFSSFRLAP
jgi:hypothetical protein